MEVMAMMETGRFSEISSVREIYEYLTDQQKEQLNAAAKEIAEIGKNLQKGVSKTITKSLINIEK